MLAKILAGEGLECKEVPINDDGSISLSVLKIYFPGSIGIRYRCKSSGSLRGTRVFNDQLLLPLGTSWNDNIFYCVYEDMEEFDRQYNILERFHLETFDMIVLGLPDDITDESFINYFSKFGELDLCKLKKNLKIKKSKGYGFLRYAKFIDQHECIKTVHIMNGSEVSLRLPSAMMDSATCKRKLFVTNITPSVTFENILEYFSVFGMITEIFMPPAASPYAFLTFDSEDCVTRVFRFGESHRVFGGYVIVERVYTKKEMNEMHNSNEEENDHHNGYRHKSNETFNSEKYIDNNNFIPPNELQNQNYNLQSVNNQICANQCNYQQYEEYIKNFNQQISELPNPSLSTQEHKFDRDSQLNNQTQYLYPKEYLPYDKKVGIDNSQIHNNYSSTFETSLHEQPPFCQRCSELATVNNYKSIISNFDKPENNNGNRFQEIDISSNFIMQTISDLATCILQEISVPHQKDVLEQVLIDKLLSSISRIPRYQQTANQRLIENNLEKIIEAIQILQNPVILDTIFQLSEKMNARRG